MGDEIETPAASPTGAPRVPTSWVPWINLVLAVSGGAAGVCAAIWGAGHWSVLVAGAVAGAGTVLLANSPGWRRAPPVALLLAGALGLSSCGHLSPVQRQLVDCGREAVARQVPGLVADVAGILAGASPDWSADLDRLIAAAGDAGICAVKVAVAELERRINQPPPAESVGMYYSPPSMPREVQLARGYSYLAYLSWVRFQ